MTARRRVFEQSLADFSAGKIDTLVGTQMLAKGHDFPNVTLVGVVSVDAGLALPDFRSAERTFQLITQVAGRGLAIGGLDDLHDVGGRLLFDSHAQRFVAAMFQVDIEVGDIFDIAVAQHDMFRQWRHVRSHFPSR